VPDSLVLNKPFRESSSIPFHLFLAKNHETKPMSRQAEKEMVNLINHLERCEKLKMTMLQLPVCYVLEVSID
jgi:hypothetical protein